MLLYISAISMCPNSIHIRYVLLREGDRSGCDGIRLDTVNESDRLRNRLLSGIWPDSMA